MPSSVCAYLVRGTAAAAGLAGCGPVRAVQPGILAQDAGVQVAQLEAGLDGQLGDQGLAQLAVGAQRVRLAARAV